MPSRAIVTVVGHLGNDPELKQAANGRDLATFSLGVSDGRKRQDGDGWEDHTTWYRCTSFQADAVSRARKGQLVQVVGKLSSRQWQTREGEARTELDVLVSDFLLCERRDATEDAPRPSAPRVWVERDDLDSLPF